MWCTVSAVCFWLLAITALISFGVCTCAMLLVAACLEIFFYARGDKRVPSSCFTSENIDDTEDFLLSQQCDAFVQHVRKDVTFHSRGHTYVCRAHALFVGHQGGRDDATTILLLHGNAASALCFAEVFDQLSEDFNVLALDMPGFGRLHCTRPTPRLETDFYTDFIVSFLAELSIPQVCVVGHSFGAFIAAHLACNSPQTVHQLLLFDAAGIFPTLGATGAYWAVFFKLSLLQTPRYFGKLGMWACFNWFHARGHSLESYYWYAVLGTPHAWGDRVMAGFISLSWKNAFWRAPVLPALERVQCRTATAYGEHDDVMPPHQGETLNELFGWPTMCFANSAHVPFRGDDAVDVGRHIVRFFRDVHTVGGAEGRTHGRRKSLDGASLLSFQSSFSTTHTQEMVESLYTHLLYSFDSGKAQP